MRTVQTFYNAEQNKRLIYQVSLGVTVAVFSLVQWLYSFFPGSYILLMVSMPLLYGSMHWLVLCVLAIIPELSRSSSLSSPSIFSVASEHDLRSTNDL